MSICLSLILTISIKSIFYTILKIIGGLILFYIVAAFIASFRKILPILQIVTAIWLMVSTIQIRNNIYDSGQIPGFFSSINMLVLPCILSVVMIFAWMGDSFFEVSVDENKLVLTNITEKWHLFKDTEVVFHFRPQESGGFLSNFMIFYILSFVYIRYICIPYSMIFCLVFPIVFIVMGIFDIFSILHIRLGNIIFRLVTIATLLGLLIFSIVVSSRNGKYANLNTVGQSAPILPSPSSEEDYLMLAELADYSDYSFEIRFYSDLDSDSTTIKYRYDSINDIGLYYKNTPYDYSPDEIYVGLVTPSDGGQYFYYSYENYEFTLVSDFNPAENGKLYHESEYINDEINYRLGFTRDLFRNSEVSMNGKHLQIFYQTDLSVGLETFVFLFEVDEYYNVTSLYSISYTRQIGSTNIDRAYLMVSNNLDYSDILEESATENTTKQEVIDYFATYGLDTYDFLYDYMNLSYDMLHNKDFTMAIQNGNDVKYIVRDSESECQVEYDDYDIFNSAFTNNNYTILLPNRITRNYFEYFDYVNDDQPFGTYTSRTYTLNVDYEYYFSDRAKNEYGLKYDEYSIVQTVFNSLTYSVRWEANDDSVTIFHEGMKSNGVDYTAQITYLMRKNGSKYEIYEFDCQIQYGTATYDIKAFIDDKVAINLSDYTIND